MKKYGVTLYPLSGEPLDYPVVTTPIWSSGDNIGWIVFTTPAGVLIETTLPFLLSTEDVGTE